MDFIIEMSKTEYVYFSVDEMLEKFKELEIKKILGEY